MMRRWFRALLRLFPSDFRGDFGAEMQEVFDDELGGATDPARRVRVLRRNATSMLKTGPRLHLEQFSQDVRYALRALRHAPVFTMVAVSALAFGIGATVVTFSLADAFLLKPLPYRDADRLVHVWAADRTRGYQELRVSRQEYEAWAARPDLFEDVAVFNYTSVELISGLEPERIAAGSVSANVFDVLGVPVIRGRSFQPGDDQLGATPVALVGEEFWRTRLGGRSDLAGTTLDIAGVRHDVVGVLPAGVNFPLPITRVWVPRVIDPARFPADVQPFQIVGRLRPGVSRAQASSALSALSPELEASYPALAGRTANVVPLRAALNFAYQMLAIGAVVMGVANLLVLLAACANISSLMLGRAIKRGREVAIRAAIGASRFRLIRQFLVESLVLSVLGAGAGAVLASWTTALLSRVIPDDLYRASAFTVDGRALLVAAALAGVAALAFGLAPALRFARVNLGDAMRQDGGAGTTSRRSLRLQSWLVEAQVALAVVLLVGTVLVARSFTALGQVEPGFDPAGVLTLQVILPSSRYADRDAVAQFHDAVTERASSVPGVVAASTVNYLPLNHESQPTRFSPAGLADDGTPRPEASLLSVGPDYFDVLRIPVIEGRSLARSDRRGQPTVAVINASMAARHWPGQSPVGAVMRLDDSEDVVTIVGVVGDTRQVDLADVGRPQIYRPQAQRPRTYFRVLARTAGEADTLRTELVAAVHDVDPILPVTEIRPLQDVVDQFLLPQRSLSAALLVLGGFSLWLALFGIYGIVTCFVADRTRELGVRVALGADASRIVRYVVLRGLRLAGRGAVIGVLLSVGTSLAMRGLLFGVGVGDPLTYVLVVGAIVVVAGAAGLLPARRAAGVSPLTAMKTG